MNPPFAKESVSKGERLFGAISKTNLDSASLALHLTKITRVVGKPDAEATLQTIGSLGGVRKCIELCSLPAGSQNTSTVTRTGHHSDQAHDPSDPPGAIDTDTAQQIQTKAICTLAALCTVSTNAQRVLADMSFVLHVIVPIVQQEVDPFRVADSIGLLSWLVAHDPQGTLAPVLPDLVPSIAQHLETTITGTPCESRTMLESYSLIFLRRVSEAQHPWVVAQVQTLFNTRVMSILLDSCLTVAQRISVSRGAVLEDTVSLLNLFLSIFIDLVPLVAVRKCMRDCKYVTRIKPCMETGHDAITQYTRYFISQLFYHHSQQAPGTTS